VLRVYENLLVPHVPAAAAASSVQLQEQPGQHALIVNMFCCSCLQSQVLTCAVQACCW
jgi:hypothetical protein